MRGAGAVRAHEDLNALDVLGRDLRERQVEHRLVVLSGVRAGVPGSEHRTERLAGLISVPVQRVESVAALVGPGRALLLRVRGDQRRVDVDRQPLGRAMHLPEPLTRAGMRGTKLAKQLLGRNPVDDPKRGRVRRDRAEQRLLLADRAEIGHALAAIGQHHRQVPDHPTRIMTTLPLLEHCQPHRQPRRQPQLVGHARAQRTTRMRHQARSVRRDIYGYQASITHITFTVKPPSSGFRTSATQESLLSRTTPRPRTPGARVLLHDPG